jgi:HSP20 family protein
MAEVAVKKASEQKASEQKTNDASSVTKWNAGGPSAYWDPFGVAPSEFFSNPFSLMRRVSEEMDRNFGRFFGAGEKTESFWSPAIEVRENNGQLNVHAELPGLKPEDVRVEVTNDQLVIQGERKYEQEDKQQGVYRSERRYGQFYRAIPLPEGANTEQAKAQFKNGVLEISIPTPEQKSNRRQIQIESK